MEEVSKKELKDAIKEALKEWLDDKYAAFGRWSFWTFMSILFIGVVYLAVLLKG